MKLAYHLGLLLLVSGGLWHPTSPTLAQISTGSTPHLAYGESLQVTAELYKQLPLMWLDVTPGEAFSVIVAGPTGRREWLRTGPSTTITPDVSKPNATATTWVYTASDSGPYLFGVIGTGDFTVTLTQGDLLRVGQGSIALGDTVTGMGSPTQVDAYTINLPADTDFTVRLISPDGTGGYQHLSLPGLRAARVKIQFEPGHYSELYHIPPELAGLHTVEVSFDSGDYTLSVVAGDDLNLDRGPLTYDAPVSGTGTLYYFDRYALDVAPGDIFTVLVDSADVAYAASVEAFGRQGTFLGSYNGQTATGYYQTFFVAAAEGPYHLYVQTTQPYTLTLIAGPYIGDAPVVRLGDAAAVTFATSIEGYWVLDAPQGEYVTLATQGSETSDINLTDATNHDLYPLTSWDTADTHQELYYLDGPAPYRVEFPDPGDFTFTTNAGDLLRVDQGEINIGQSVQATAESGQSIVYTLPAVESGQATAITTSGLSNFRVIDANGYSVDYFYFNFPTPDTPYAAYQLAGLCPCQLQLGLKQLDYTLELNPIAPDVFPDPQPLILGEAVTGDTGVALIVPYTFEASGDQDLMVRLEFDPAQTDGSRLYLEIQTPGEEEPTYLLLDQSQTEVGDGYIVQHYPLYFPGTYTLRIKNLVGPYTLTVQ